MYKTFFNKKPVIENSECVNVSAFIRNNFLQILN